VFKQNNYTINRKSIIKVKNYSIFLSRDIAEGRWLLGMESLQSIEVYIYP